MVLVTCPLDFVLSSKTPSSSGKPCCHHIGSVATVGTPVRSCSICGPGGSNLASPLNLFKTNPLISFCSSESSIAQVPYRCANAPPRSMSVTSRQAALAYSATRMLTMSLCFKLISAGEPAPSITTTSFSAISSPSACATTGQTCALRPRHAIFDNSAFTCPIKMTWLWVSFSGLSSNGFIRTSGVAFAASA